MGWSGKEKQTFRDAILDAYRDYGRLKIFVRDELDWALPEISQDPSLQIVTFELIEWAESRGELDRVLNLFLAANPKCSHLRSVCRDSAPNSGPFIYGPAITPEGFYGRSPLIREIKTRIGGVTPQCVNVVGMRRAGKSSLLRLIAEDSGQFFSEDCQPLIVNLDLSDRRFQSPDGIQEGLRAGIMEQGVRSPWPENCDDPFVFGEGLERLREEGRRLVVLLDEFEAIAQHLAAFQGWGEDWRAKARRLPG